MRILAIDPGLANTGLVLFDAGTITAVRTIKTTGAGHKVDFRAALVRCDHVAGELDAFMVEHEPAAIVVELYRDIPGELRKAANRWATPLLIGYLAAGVLAAHSPRVVFQDPEFVLTRRRKLVRMWKAGRRGLVPGDELVTNEHLRSAAAHGVDFIALSRSGAHR